MVPYMAPFVIVGVPYRALIGCSELGYNWVLIWVLCIRIYPIITYSNMKYYSCSEL